MVFYSGIVCVALPAPDNFGRVSYSLDTSEPYDVGTVATYSCNTDIGYGLTGSTTRTCVDGDRLTIVGLWNGVSPTCDCEFVYKQLLLHFGKNLPQGHQVFALILNHAVNFLRPKCLINRTMPYFHP